MKDIKFDKNEKMSKSELELLGSEVTQKECDMLGYSSLKSYTIIKDGENDTFYSSTISPLFLITCKYWNKRKEESCFYVIYEPLSDQPNGRFRYYGVVPQGYISKFYHEQLFRRGYNKRYRETVSLCFN